MHTWGVHFRSGPTKRSRSIFLGLHPYNQQIPLVNLPRHTHGGEFISDPYALLLVGKLWVYGHQEFPLRPQHKVERSSFMPGMAEGMQFANNSDLGEIVKQLRVQNPRMIGHFPHVDIPRIDLYAMPLGETDIFSTAWNL